MPKLLMIDSNPGFRETFVLRLRDELPSASVSQAETAAQARKWLASGKTADFALLHYADDSDMSLARTLAEARFAPKVIVYSAQDRSNRARKKAIEAGAWTYFYRGRLLEEVADLIDRIHDLTELQRQLAEGSPERDWLMGVIGDLGAGVMVIDRDYRIWYVNRKQQEIGEGEYESGRLCWLPCRSRQAQWEPCRSCPAKTMFRALDSGAAWGSAPVVMPKLTPGALKFLQASATPLWDSKRRRVIGAVLCVSDVTDTEIPRLVADEAEIHHELETKVKGLLRAIQEMGYARVRTFRCSPTGKVFQGYLEVGGRLSIDDFGDFSIPVEVEEKWFGPFPEEPTPRGEVRQLTPEMANDERHQKYILVPLQMQRVRRWIEFPLWHGRVPIGKLVLDNYTPEADDQAINDLGETDCELIAPFAQLCGKLIGVTLVYEEYIESVQMIRRLRRMDERIWRQGSLDAVLQTIIDTAIEFTGAESGHLRTKEGGFLVARAGRGIYYSTFCGGPRERVPVDDYGSTSSRAVRERRFVQWDNAQREPAWQRQLEEADLSPQMKGKLRVLRSHVAVPIMTDEVIGVIGLQAREVGFFSARKCHFIQEFCARAALAISHEWWQNERLRRQEATLSAWREFISQATHRLNNPLSVVHGSLTMASRLEGRGELDAAKATDYLHKIRDQVKTLGKVTDSMREYGRQTAIETAPLRADTRDIVADLTAFVSDFLQARPKLQCQVKAAGEPIAVETDFDLLHEIIGELLTNAEKHAGKAAGTAVEIKSATSDIVRAHSLAPRTPYVCIAVIDSGPGIQPDLKEKVFLPLYTLREKQGMGMGLAIIKRQVRRLGGDVRETGVYGEGTRFQITIPQRRKGSEE